MSSNTVVDQSPMVETGRGVDRGSSPRPRRIFQIESYVPDPSGTAGHVVASEISRLMSKHGHQVILQIIFGPSRRDGLNRLEEAQIERLKTMGVEVLPPLFCSAVTGSIERGSLSKIFRYLFLTSALYPSIAFRDEVQRRIMETYSDVVLIHASPEGLAASYRVNVVPKVAHYGVIDHWPIAARLKSPALFDVPSASLNAQATLLFRRLVNRRRKRVHFNMIRDCTAVPIPDAGMARAYTAMGHPRAFYLQNMWPDRYGASWRSLRDELEVTQPLKLAANIGHVNATGVTFGLLYIGKYLLPLLDRQLGPRGYEVHIYGKGAPTAHVARYLAHPQVKLRGFVPDLDREFFSCPIFLNMVNSGDFRDGQTRMIYAWSLGTCVVAHKNYLASVPEVDHMRNALLGETPEEIVDCVVQAANDPQLRRRIGAAARATYEQFFTPEQVVPKLVREVERVVGEHRGST